MPTKSDLEAENARLRAEVDTLKFAMRCLIDADRHMSSAMHHASESTKYALEAMGVAHGLVPSLPNN
jgi:hypothetical protein